LVWELQRNSNTPIIMKRTQIGFAMLMLALGIGAGAMGAHSLENVLSLRYLQVWETAWRYWMYNMLGIMVLATFVDPIRNADQLSDKFYGKWGVFRWLWIGSVTFTGTLCLVSVNELFGHGLRKFGAITPIGGMILIFAWAIGGIALLRHRKQFQ